ncbi:MAG: anthranilate synthase component II [Idiomarinaceae bacterium HL-53]|nr:MAG: anthranilate synthase component II [Idiomarinaceae bacterium HL-53]CUS48179.1 anthranilate synthase, component II [Idiomarinaceae bacterium HL-53]
MQLTLILIIDNYDSFTHNVARYFEELGQVVKVVRNDEITIAEIELLAVRALVISPGPCTPKEAGISLQAIRHFADKLPILGVCLGHQAIGQAFGGEVVRAAQIMHGKSSLIEHSGEGLFAGMPQPLKVIRYHSLVVKEDNLPACLEACAWVARDSGHRVRELMGLQHRSLPIFGVQFHPESVLSEAGHSIFAKFCELAGLKVDRKGLARELS